MKIPKTSLVRPAVIPALTLIACLSLASCGSGSDSSTAEEGNTTSSDTMDEGEGNENNEENNGADSNTTNEVTDVEYLNPIDISTDLQPSSDDSGMEYELLGYRLHRGVLLAMDVLATNNSNVTKTMGSCTAEALKDESFIELTSSTFLSGAPLRPNDEMLATIFFSDVSDPSQVDNVVADCNFNNLVISNSDASITYDFIEFTGPDNLGRIFVNIQINNNSGDTIEFARCDFSARNGNRIVENARIEFNFGREILPGEAYIGEGILVLEFNEFESDSFDPADVHCDYSLT